MKLYLNLFLTSFLFVCSGQSLQVKNHTEKFKNCTSKACKIKYAFRNAEFYLEDDEILSSQKWLDIVKNNTSLKIKDSTNVFIYSLQSELFYYNGLYQFGINEAEKAIAVAHNLKDSLLISNGYFFKGINLFELNKSEEAQQFLWKSRNYQPKGFQKKYLRSAILNEHIFNNLAQVKNQLRQSDSAIWYNSRAYLYAKKNRSKRGIPNVEQTFGQIYLKNNKIDSAFAYLNKSILSAQKNNYYDIVLINYGLLLQCYPNNQKESNFWFNKGLDLIKEKKINVSYQCYFFKIVIKAFKRNNQSENLIFAQESLINISEKISLDTNDYIQNITKQYLKNENILLKQEVVLIEKTNQTRIFIFAILLLTIASVGIWLYFKQRQKLKNQEIETLKQSQEIIKLEALIDGEENERKRIAQELHDGINGDLSAIKYRISSLEEDGIGTTEKADLQKIIEMIDHSCSQIRNISHNLMPTSIIDFGLVETIGQYCAKINSSQSIEFDFQHFGNAIILPKKAETVIYRIVQELINNIVKHSKATKAIVQMNYHEYELFITVEDNGIGFDTTITKSGIGLKNIASRVDFLKANLEIESTIKGSSFNIIIDLKKI